ncbi:BMP family lipoprotein [Leadbettera azotonutricia]|uniref:Basic membrane lipoprotein n=1 Tax=Leadbettera azotonutricia (strain ATCC BAA-888 / DSM 13862 / ZAS-9) TaxID=545695 RepID=F5Y700_LEAAZ|nr:BMP family ABC transporter substrate-binding protein [Leadbettera azotonutricia]AEF80755.1 basic membrane lipoprotein [Leadbettera azotonutricia ZAS-9]
MKRILNGIVVAALVAVALVTAACNKKAAPASTSAAPATTAVPAAPEVTVSLLTDATGIDDKSFNAAAWRGILEFYGDTWQNTTKRGKSYDVVTAQTQDMYIPNIRQATDEGYSLIVTTGFTFADALAEVAAQNPNQKYMIVDVDWVNLPNVLQAMFAEHEGSYLVGVAAALKAKADNIANPRFGFIGGVPGTTITKFEVGYVQGILSVFPNAQIVDYYVNSWGEPALAKTQAKNWYDSGVYAIYSAAGGSGNGTIAQAKEYRQAGRNVWAIGVDSDQHEEGLLPNSTESAVLTSMLKQVETSLVYGLNAVKNNAFKGEVITLDLKAEGVGYSTTNPAITADIKSQLQQVKQQIVSGQIKIAATNADAKKIAGFPQDLKAQDN